MRGEVETSSRLAWALLALVLAEVGVSVVFAILDGGSICPSLFPSLARVL